MTRITSVDQLSKYQFNSKTEFLKTNSKGGVEIVKKSALRFIDRFFNPSVYKSDKVGAALIKLGKTEDRLSIVKASKTYKSFSEQVTKEEKLAKERLDRAVTNLKIKIKRFAYSHHDHLNTNINVQELTYNFAKKRIARLIRKHHIKDDSYGNNVIDYARKLGKEVDEANLEASLRFAELYIRNNHTANTHLVYSAPAQ